MLADPVLHILEHILLILQILNDLLMKFSIHHICYVDYKNPIFRMYKKMMQMLKSVTYI
jgi:hypothetical protein